MNIRRNLLVQALLVSMLTLASSIGVSGNDAETVQIEGTATILTGNVQPVFIPNELVRIPNSLIGQPGPGGFQETFRFDDPDVEVTSGGTIRWTNTTSFPHTITIVRRVDQPQTLSAAFACFSSTCAAALAKHFPNGFDPATGQPRPPIVLDSGTFALGDTHLIGPVGGPGRTSFEAVVNAPAGTTLFYMCSFHPQMQGKIVVEGD